MNYSCLALGVPYPSGYNFPWRDIKSWWRKEQGYQELSPLYDANGNYVPKFNSRKNLLDYWQHQREWDKANPMPVEELVIGADTYMLAVPDTIIATDGIVEIEGLIIIEDQKYADFRNYLLKYNLLISEPKHYLFRSING